MEEHEDMSFSTRIVRKTKFYVRVLWKKYQSLALRGKVLLFALIFFYGLLGFFAAIWPGAATIAQTLYDWAHRTSQHPYGWAVFLGIITLVSFPPAAGHTTTLILCGFAYGMKGFYLAAGASVFASALVFVTLRALFSRRLQAWSVTNEKWQALESVIKAKGLPLICLIRMSPLPPWVYSNALFASIGPVKLWQFVIAQTFVFPKILLSVFIGSRAAALADGDQRGHMDRLEKWLNIGLIGLSMSIGFATSWFIYRQVRARIRHLDDVPPVVDELAAEALEDATEDAPLLGV